MQDGQQNEPGWVFKPGDTGAQAAPVQAAVLDTPAPQAATPAPRSKYLVSWTASEYIANPKTAGWFGLLILLSVLLSIVAYIITKDWVSTGVILILGILVGVFAARQPRVLEYKVDNAGIYIGDKFYPYGMFKSFSVAQEHAIGLISFTPLKRFMPPLSVHYAPEDEERIANTLADYLPYEEYKNDIIDNLSRRFRF